MKLKKLAKKDIPSILLLERHHAPNEPYYSKYGKKALNFLFDNPKTSKVIGLFDNNKLIGWGSYRTNWHRHKKEKDVFEISSIVINTNYRRKGLGQKILNKMLSDWKKQKHDKVFLTVSPHNTGALLLYLKNGFIVYNYKKNVYRVKGSDRLYLSLSKD